LAVGFWADEPLCLADAEEPSDTAAFGTTPGPFGWTPLCASFAFESGLLPRVVDVKTSCDKLAFGMTPELRSPASALPGEHGVKGTVTHEEGSYLKQVLHDYLGQSQNLIQEDETTPRQFCPHEPLCFDAADYSSHVPWFGPTPGPFGWSPSPQPARAVTAPTLPSLLPWKDGKLISMVQRTFIHAQSPAKSPLLGSLRRSSSTGDLSESTRTRSASREGSESNHDFVDSPRYQDNSSLLVADSKDSIPPTPMMWMPSTPFTPQGREYSAPLLQQHCAALPFLRLSDLVA